MVCANVNKKERAEYYASLTDYNSQTETENIMLLSINNNLIRPIYFLQEFFYFFKKFFILKEITREIIVLNKNLEHRGPLGYSGNPLCSHNVPSIVDCRHDTWDFLCKKLLKTFISSTYWFNATNSQKFIQYFLFRRKHRFIPLMTRGG